MRQRRGIYQGIFNFFIVLPEIAVSLFFGWIMSYLLNDNRLWAVVLGGVFLIIGAGLTLLVKSSPISELEAKTEVAENKETTQTTTPSMDF